MGAELSAAVLRDLALGDGAALLELYRHLHERDEPPPGDGAAVWEQICLDPA